MIPGQPQDSLTGRTLLRDSCGDKEKNGVSDSGTPPARPRALSHKPGRVLLRNPVQTVIAGVYFFATAGEICPSTTGAGWREITA
ncbi:hypothetical protein GCM10009414_06270 [Tatumella terrea]